MKAPWIKLSTRDRRRRALRNDVYDGIRSKALLETSADDLRAVLQRAGSFANACLRHVYNLARGLGWLPWEIIAPRSWPRVPRKPRRAISKDEHERIIAVEQNEERRRYYELLWETGSGQTDGANLKAANINWPEKVLSYQRIKTGESCYLSIGSQLQELLRALPTKGYLFPKMHLLRDKDRAAEFARRCRVVGFKGISLHSYRYAWAERAVAAGVPERFAQAALGHASKAVHRVYAKKAMVKVPSLEEYELAQIQKGTVNVGVKTNDLTRIR